MTERRFTDREIGLILRRAVELEESADSERLPGGRGLTLTELQGIGREAGINPEMIGRAVQEMEGRRGIEPLSLIGPPTVKREVRTFPGEMSREAIGELMRTVDQEVEAQGTVVEALGGVRWTSNTRFLSTQVSVEPSGEDTLLRVEERYSDIVRGPLHGVPMGWGWVIGMGVGIETLGLALPLLLVLIATLGMVGWAAGDLVWRAVSASSKKRVRRLMDRLTTEAQNLLPPPKEQEV